MPMKRAVSRRKVGIDERKRRMRGGFRGAGLPRMLKRK